MSGGQKIMKCRKEEPVKGFEPPADGLQNRCSTPELHRQNYLLRCELYSYDDSLSSIFLVSFFCV